MRDTRKTKRQLVYEIQALRESEAKCRTLFEESKDAMVVTALDGKVEEFNEAAVELFGYSGEELKEVNIKEIYVNEKDRTRFQKEMGEKGFLRNYKVRLRRKDGREMDCLFTMTVRSQDGRIVGYHGIIRDISEQRQAEELYSKLAQNAQAGVYVVQNGKFQFVNPHIIEYSGYSKKELVAMQSLHLVHPEDREAMRLYAIDMLKGRSTVPYEYRLVSKNGKIRKILETVTSIEYFGERAVLANSMDITAERETKERLAQAKALESSILSAMPHAIIGLENRRIIFANEAVKKVFGWDPEDVIGEMTRIFYRSDKDFEEIGRRFYPVLEKQETYSEEFPCQKKDGTDIVCMVSTARVGGELKEKRIIVVYEDITERKQAEDALRESEEKYSAVVEQAMYGVVIIQEEKYQFANSAMEDITGFPVNELIGMHFLDIFTIEYRRLVYQRYKKRMAGGRVLPVYETKVFCKDGTIRDVEIAFGIITINKQPADMGYIRDITIRKKAQEELTRSFASIQKRLEETVNALASMTEKRDPYTAGHQQRVTQLARAIAKEMHLTDNRIEGIAVAATLHDIGKIYEPAEILSKPDILTEIEFLMMKVHPEVGYEILKNIDFPWPVAQIVKQHHERYDGSGYPEGLKGEEILLEARILAVADVVEAMASHRPYRSALGIQTALEEIKNNRDVLYDPEVVDACMKVFEVKKFEFGHHPYTELQLRSPTTR